MNKNEYQDKNSNEFLFWARKATSPLKDYEEIFLKEVIESNQELKVLEGGTGSGRIASGINKKNNQLEIDAFDSSELLLNIAIKENSKYGINFFYDDIVKLKNIKNIKNFKKYDCIIYLGQVLSCVNINNQVLALKEAAKYLKKDGSLFMSLCYHNSNNLTYLRNLLFIFLRTIFTFRFDFHKIIRFRVTGTKFTLGKDFMWWHNKKTAINLLQNSGYKIEKIGLRKDLLNGKGSNGFIYIKAKVK